MADRHEPPEPGAVRQAALLVHAMAPADREWLLAALAPALRGSLHAPLEELRQLGIPRDPRWLREALADAAPPAEDSDPARALERLTGAQVRSLAASMGHEPAALVARLLAAQTWPWRNEFLQALEPATCRDVLDAAAPVAAPAFDAALCAAAWRRVSANLGTPSRAPGGRWPTLLRMVHRKRSEG